MCIRDRDDLAQNSIILEHIVLGNHGVAVLVVCEAGAVSHIGAALSLIHI